MMGRSHALLGALGYAALTPLATLDLPYSKEIITIAWCVPFIFVSAAPAKLKDSLFNVIYVTFYWIMMICVVGVGIMLASQWVYEFAPEVFPNEPHERFVWMMVAAGFALIPDIDEPNSTVARVFGPVSRAMSAVTRELAGGHRKGTHSWIFAIMGLGLAFIGIQHPIVAGVIISIAFVFSVRMLVPDKATGAGYLMMVIGVVTAWLAVAGSIPLEPMILAIVAGILLHDLGDWLTNTGIPFWWPVKKKYTANFFSTGSDTETYFVRPIMFVSWVAVLFFWVIVPFTHWIGEEGPGGIFEDLPSISRQA